jgi:hypothetical protein
MSHAPCRALPEGETVPAELLELRERLLDQPSDVRAALAPLVEEALEDARFRHRVLGVARDALEKFRLDLELARFDLDATRRERETLLRRLERRCGTG